MQRCRLQIRRYPSRDIRVYCIRFFRVPACTDYKSELQAPLTHFSKFLVCIRVVPCFRAQLDSRPPYPRTYACSRIHLLFIIFAILYLQSRPPVSRNESCLNGLTLISPSIHTLYNMHIEQNVMLNACEFHYHICALQPLHPPPHVRARRPKIRQTYLSTSGKTAPQASGCTAAVTSYRSLPSTTSAVATRRNTAINPDPRRIFRAWCRRNRCM